MRVLIAEDDFTSRRILTSVVKKWGFDVVAVDNGLAAWEEFNAPRSPDLLLLDWNMPGMDGVEICARIGSLGLPSPPYVILITGRGERDDIVAGLNSGANDYITKPYDIEELRARIAVGARVLEMQTELVRMRDEMAHLASHDALTGLLNRRAVMNRLEAELSRAQRLKSTICLAMCDIDHFKLISDTYGHQAGDDVLGAVSRALVHSVRPYDCVGRVGGEEFLVVLPLEKPDCMKDIFERIREEIAMLHISHGAISINVTISIGGVLGQGGDKAPELLARADAALYRAKALGRNRVEIADQ